MKKSTRVPLSPEVRELLARFLKVAKKVRKPYAIGGAVAMAAHGYVRETEDLDAFLLLEDRIAWATALRKEGFRVEPLFREVHHVAFLPKHGDPSIRIDLLFPADEPELSAVEAPDRGKLGVTFKVFPRELLALAKWGSDREKDHADFWEMLERGLFDVRRALRILSYYDRESARRLAKTLKARGLK